MFSKFPSSRLAVFALICSAVMSFIMCSDAARARPMAAQKHKGVRQIFQRRWVSPYNSHSPSPVGLPSPNTGRQLETGIKTETRGGFRPTPLIIERPQNTPRFVKGNVRFNRHSPRNGKHRLGMNKVQRGHGNGNAKRPANNAFTRQAQQTERYEKWHSKNTGHAHSQKKPQNGDLFEVHRKTTQKKFPHLFQQRSKSHSGGVGHQGALVRVNGNNAAQTSSGFPSQTGGYWDAVMSPPLGNRGVYNKANGHPAPGWITGGIQSSKFHKVSNHPTPRVASMANNFVSSVIQRDPNPKRVAPSIRDFFKPRGSVSSGDALKNKKVKSYQMKDAHTLLTTITGDVQEALNRFSDDETLLREQNPFSARVPQRSGLNSAKLDQRSPTKPDKGNAFVSGTQVFTTNQPITVKPQSRLPGRDVKKLFPSRLVPSWARLDSKRGKSRSRQANNTTRGPPHDYEAGQSGKRLFDLRSFNNPPLEAVKEPSTFLSKAKPSSQRFGFGNGKDSNKAKVHTSVPSKYSFDWRGAPPPSPAQPEIALTDSSLNPFVTETKSGKIPRIFTSGFRSVKRILAEHDTPVEGNSKDAKFKIYSKTFNLKAPDTQPQPEAETSLSDPSEGLTPRMPQIWKPRSVRVHRWDNRTKDQEAKSTARPNKVKPFFGTLGTTEHHASVTPDERNKNTFYDQLKFWLDKNATDRDSRKIWQKHMKGDPTTAFTISSARPRPNAGLDIQSSPTAESEKPILRKAISLMNPPFSSSMRGQHMKGKHTKAKGKNSGELPTHPARIKPVTYTDILGSVSSSAARDINHTPNVSANRDYLPTLTAEAKQPWAGHWVLNSDDSVNRNSSPEPKRVHKVAIPAEKNKPRKSKEGVNETKRLQIFFDREESGSGSFNLPDSEQKSPP